MPATFSIDVDVANDLVRVSMSGFFEPDDIARFRYARDMAHRKLTCGAHEHLTLVDIREMHIQSQEAVADFGRILANPQYRSRLIAVVVSQSLARMQIKRAAAGRDIAYFAEDIAAAERWLLTDAARAA